MKTTLHAHEYVTADKSAPSSATEVFLTIIGDILCPIDLIYVRSSGVRIPSVSLPCILPRLHDSLVTADRDNHATSGRELDRRQRSLSTESVPDVSKIPVKVSIIISGALARDRSAGQRGARSTRCNRKNSAIPPDPTWKVPRDY